MAIIDPQGFRRQLAAVVCAPLNSDRLALAVVTAVMTVLIVVRFVHAYVTGFLLPDEAYYYGALVLHHDAFPQYTREVFASIYTVFFWSTSGVTAFLLRAALWCVTWAIGCLLILYRTLRILNSSVVTRSMILLSMPLIPVFTIMAPFAVTETLGLFLVLCGIYLNIAYLESLRARYSLLSSVAYVLAYKCREPYIFFAIGNLLPILISLKTLGWRKGFPALVGYTIPLLLVLPIPTTLSPNTVAFSLPLYVYLARQIAVVATFMTVTTTTAGTTAVQAGGFVISFGSLSDTVKGFALSLMLGYNPLFAALIAISIGLSVKNLIHRKLSKLDFFIAYNTVLALLNTWVTVAYWMINGFQWLSGVIRLSHTSLPSTLSLQTAYSRISSKNFLRITLILILLIPVAVPVYEQILQRSLSRSEGIDRLSFDYRAPYYRLSLLVKNTGRTLVIGGIHMRYAEVYLFALPNVVLVGVPPTRQAFDNLTAERWDTILLYDDYYTIRPEFQNVYPSYYWDIMTRAKSNAGFTIEAVWVDGESYCLRLVRTQ